MRRWASTPTDSSRPRYPRYPREPHRQLEWRPGRCSRLAHRRRGSPSSDGVAVRAEAVVSTDNRRWPVPVSAEGGSIARPGARIDGRGRRWAQIQAALSVGAHVQRRLCVQGGPSSPSLRKPRSACTSLLGRVCSERFTPAILGPRSLRIGTEPSSFPTGGLPPFVRGGIGLTRTRSTLRSLPGRDSLAYRTRRDATVLAVSSFTCGEGESSLLHSFSRWSCRECGRRLLGKGDRHLPLGRFVPVVGASLERRSTRRSFARSPSWRWY